ncbi:MAG: CocE/NonD family hydrolase [Myxococcales bacterium]|nr:CocE/NonD family hydrolase [Myxococcales bacterium]
MLNRSLYLTMPDGVRLAVDVHLPAGDGPFPTILHQTRYFRAVGMRRGWGWVPLASAMDTDWGTRQRFLAAGWAWVSVCVRGSGASSGTSPFPWSEPEVQDGARVLDWIVAQPWSDGLVGSTGISYAGTSAEMLASLGHPALRAIAPRFSCFDVYADVAFPGGLHLESFTRDWATLNRLLDSGDIGGAVAHNLGLSGRGCRDLGARYAWLKAADHPAARRTVRALVRLVAHGAAHVHGDHRRDAARAAIAEHAGNDDIHEGALRVTCRDDGGLSPSVPDAAVDSFSPHRRAEALRDTGVAVLSYSGWLDGGYAAAAAKRWARVGGQLVLGPWNHGGQEDTSPFTPLGPARDDHAGTLLDFFDHHVRGRPRENDAPVRYFTLGEERWKSASEWPPRGHVSRSLYLGPADRLTETLPVSSGVTSYRVDPDVGTGHRSRWNSLLGLKAPIGYAGAADLCRRATCFTSEPLPGPLEVTGSPNVALALASSHSDGSVFVYLADIAPDGRVTIVTEGMLRLLHRRGRSYVRADARALVPGDAERIEVELLPVSYRFGAGHRIRLALTGADTDHFRAVTDAPPTIEWLWGADWASRLVLPVIDVS